MPVALGAARAGPFAPGGAAFTSYVAPEVSAVSPGFSDVHAAAGVAEVTGSGFFALGDGRLLCRWGDHPPVAASLVDPSRLRCASPAGNGTAFALPLGVSVDGGARFVGGHAPPPTGRTVGWVFVDGEAPPALSAAAPAYGDVDGGASVTIDGANFAPTAALACAFGDAHVRLAPSPHAGRLRRAARRRRRARHRRPSREPRRRPLVVSGAVELLRQRPARGRRRRRP